MCVCVGGRSWEPETLNNEDLSNKCRTLRQQTSKGAGTGRIKLEESVKEILTGEAMVGVSAWSRSGPHMTWRHHRERQRPAREGSRTLSFTDKEDTGRWDQTLSTDT